MAAWVAGVAASWVIVSSVEAQTFVWGFFGPSRTGSSPLEFSVERAEVTPLAVVLLAVPVIFAAFGWFGTRDRAEVIRQDQPTPLSPWSRAGAVAVVALVPNLVGCLWISATRSTASALMDLTLAWPYLAAVFVPLAWEARTIFHHRAGAL